MIPELKLGSKTKKCPKCGSDWEYEVKGEKYSRLIGIEDPKVYDGVSWWRCPDCGATWSRWTGELEDSEGKSEKQWVELARKARNKWFSENP